MTIIVKFMYMDFTCEKYVILVMMILISSDRYNRQEWW
jgi:hypothetical protein